MTNNTYIYVNNVALFDLMVDTMNAEPEFIVLDTETNTLRLYQDSESLIGISIWCPKAGKGFYAPFRHGYKPGEDTTPDPDNLPIEWLPLIPTNREGITYIGYNMLFDLTVLERNGMEVPALIEDVWTAAFLLNENEDLTASQGRSGAYGLKRLARTYLGDETEGEEALYDALKELGYGVKDRGNERFWKANMWRLPGAQTSLYAIDDVRLTWELREFYRPALVRWQQWELYQERNRYYRKVAYRMERNGILVDPEMMDVLSAEAREAALQVHRRIVAIAEQAGVVTNRPELEYQAYPFNPRSAQAVVALLEATGYPTDNARAATLEELAQQGSTEAAEVLVFKAALSEERYEEALDSLRYLCDAAVQAGVIPAYDSTQIEQELLKQKFNPDSPRQVKTLFARMDYPLVSTEKASLEVLEKQGNTLAELVLHYRMYSKAESTYYTPWREAMDENHRIHSTMRTNTVTGRPNSYDPNLQNIPREGKYPVKKALVAPPGYVVVEIDYRSQELFVAAHFARCESMGRLVSEGQDLHWYTTENMGVRDILYPGMPDEKILHLMGIDNIGELTTVEKREKVNKGLRQVGKILNFAIMYGAGANSLTKLLNVTRGEAYKLIDAWYAVYPEIKALSDDLQEMAKTGRGPSGGPGKFHYHRNPDGLVRHFDAYRVAGYGPPTHVCLNVLVQGYSGTITRRAWLRIVEEFPDDEVMAPILNLYDATYAYVREDMVDTVVPRMMEIMTDFDMSPRLQVEASLGYNWNDKEEYHGLSGRD